MKRILIILLLLGAPTLTSQQQGDPRQFIVYEDALTGVSGIQASAPLRSIGQSMHTIQVVFPAETTAVDPIDVVLEWCPRDCDLDASWRAAGRSIVIAPVKSQGVGATDVIAFQTYYGAFRSIRVRNNVATPGGELMTVRYFADVRAVVPFVIERADRWEF